MGSEDSVIAASSVAIKPAGVFVGARSIHDPRDELRGVSWGLGQRGGLRGRPREGRTKPPARTSFWEPSPAAGPGSPGETSPSASRYLYKYVYDDPRLSVKLFFSGGGPRLAAPLKNLSSQTRQADPEKEVTFLASSGIRQLAPGGKARAFADIVGDRLGQSEQRQFQNLAQTLIPYATGDSLDLLGEIYGVARIGQSSVVADLSDQNFEFYVRRGMFGDINNGNDIEIPRDTRVSPATPMDRFISPTR